MSKHFGDLDWSEELQKTDNYEHVPTTLWAADQSGGKQGGVDPLNKAELKVKPYEEPYRPTNEEITAAVMHNAPRQPTDEQMFGHLVVTEEQAQKAKAEWENKLQKNIDDLNAPINPGNEETAWGSGKSFNSTLTEEERLYRNMYTDE